MVFLLLSKTELGTELGHPTKTELGTELGHPLFNA
jgi:hypothetical protein